MALQINEVTGRWLNAAPSNANLNGKSVGTEERITWGTPDTSSSAQSGYGFRGLFPPVKFVKKGDKILLGRLRHFNHPIDCPCLTSVDLEVTIDAARNGKHKAIISFTHDETNNTTGDPVLDSDIVTVTAGFPQTISFPANDGTAQLKLTGFQTEDGDIVEEFRSPERDVNKVWLVAEVVDDGEIDPECTDPAESIFQPAGCVIDCVPPIEDKPIIVDCEVPEAPEEITDCPAIDIPTSIIIDPPPPPDPPPICQPEIFVSYGYTCVPTREEVRVAVYSFPTGQCDTLLYFYFYLYCPEPYEEECCWWIWCPCDDGYCTSGFSLAAATDCPHTDICTASPGHWVLLKGSTASCVYPPCNEGDYYGQVEISCDCPCVSSSSSSSSSAGPINPSACCCWDTYDEAPDCLFLDMSATPSGTCDNLSVDHTDPCIKPHGALGNVKICKTNYYGGPWEETSLPAGKCVLFTGMIDIACTTGDSCCRTMHTAFYCYEDANGDHKWAFWGSIDPGNMNDPDAVTPLPCVILKDNIPVDGCDPLSVTFDITKGDFDGDGATDADCELCDFTITITQAPPED